jgi:hypothetical protein
MASVYCLQADIEAIYGVDNVTAWATLSSGDGNTERTARITLAIGVASDDLDEVLRCVTGYESKLPIGTVPPNVKDKVAIRAGLWLYDHRAQDDYNAQSESYPTAKLKEYRRWLAELLAGKRKLDIG